MFPKRLLSTCCLPGAVLSTSCVLSQPHNSPMSYELNRPILPVRKLRLKEEVTFQLPKVTQPGRIWWSLCTGPAPPTHPPRPSDFQVQTSHHGRVSQWSVIWPPHQEQGTPLLHSQRVATGLSSPGSPKVIRPPSAPPAPGQPYRNSDGVPQGSPSRLSSRVIHQHQ